MKQKILILGIQGMLGHRLFSQLSELNRYSIYATVRNQEIIAVNIFNNIDAFSIQSIEKIIVQIKPDTIINCIGIIKQSPLVESPKISIYINSYFPHLLNEICINNNIRLIQISTDCVFDGKQGYYDENFNPNPADLYGRTKLLGEVIDENSLTIRTSIIGHELKTTYGLLEWFLSMEKSVKGFKNAVFSGFTTNELSRIISDFILPNPALNGLYHVASMPIDKFSLLSIVKNAYKKDIDIVPDEQFICNRSLNGERFNKMTGYVAPSWNKMIEEMYNDKTTHESFRK